MTACTPGPGPERVEKPHPYFPTGPGTPHAAVECQSCHPPASSTFAQFQCLACHPESVHPKVDRFVYESRACFGCHGPGALASDPTLNVTVTAQVPSFSGTIIDEVTEARQTLPMTMNHGSLNIPRSASACASCHRDFELGLFYGGQYHATLLDLGGPTPQSCSECHFTAMPFGFVGAAKGPPRTPASGSMRHDALGLDGGALVNADCRACHVAPQVASSADWRTNTSFHEALVAGGRQPDSCVGCHANARPGVVDRPGRYRFNHQAEAWLGDCVACHTVHEAWSTGRFHASAGTPAACLPCHETRRPAETSVFTGPLMRPAPFDYVPNALGIGHGADQDCAVCHGTKSDAWDGGFFPHGPATIANRTCLVCHTTQRPSDPTHVQSGDCFGCHQASAATPHLSVAEWAGGRSYPDDVLVGSPDHFIKVTSFALRRGGPNNLVNAAVPSEVTLFNSMLHSSQQVPPALRPVVQPDDCRRCHTASTFLDAGFHAPVAGAGASQPTSCLDCHANMTPPGIVKQTDLRPMNHSVDAGVTDCVACHGGPSAGWDGGAGFHARGAGASDCLSCHFPLMASAGPIDGGSTYLMKHLSPQVTVQQCSVCHPSALASASQVTASAWRPGALHANVQPQACVDCHAVTRPAPTRSMNHGDPVAFARDCSFCHQNLQFSAGTKLHRPGIAAVTCAGCHRDAPDAGFVTDVITSASASTGRAGEHAQISHAQQDVASRDCSFCHVAPVDAGTTFAGAKMHVHFTGAVALTGRCSACHLNLKPVATYPGHDHSAYSDTSPTDCRACHAWPGTGTPTAPNWHAPPALAPSTMTVGGFSVAQPPAASSGVVQAGLTGLQHPAVPAGGSCTSCHSQAAGGRNAFAYDHALAPSTGCNACHEAGSDLVATPWSPGTGAIAASCTLGGGMILPSGGDTRPVGLTSLPCAPSATAQTIANHFYPADCGECHRKPSDVPAATSTGAPYSNAWRFIHSFGAPIQQGTCCGCHAPPSCRG